MTFSKLDGVQEIQKSYIKFRHEGIWNICLRKKGYYQQETFGINPKKSFSYFIEQCWLLIAMETSHRVPPSVNEQSFSPEKLLLCTNDFFSSDTAKKNLPLCLKITIKELNTSSNLVSKDWCCMNFSTLVHH